MKGMSSPELKSGIPRRIAGFLGGFFLVPLLALCLIIIAVFIILFGEGLGGNRGDTSYIFVFGFFFGAILFASILISGMLVLFVMLKYESESRPSRTSNFRTGVLFSIPFWTFASIGLWSQWENLNTRPANPEKENFFPAIRHGNFDRVEALLADDKSIVNTSDPEGLQTPLEIAVEEKTWSW